MERAARFKLLARNRIDHALAAVVLLGRLISHAELFHHAPGASVLWRRDRDDARQALFLEAVTQPRRRDLRGVALAPVRRVEAVTDFYLFLRFRRTLPVPPELQRLQPAPADESAAGLLRHRRHAEAVSPVAFEISAHALAYELRRLQPGRTEVTGDLFFGAHRTKRGQIVERERAQPEPLGFDSEVHVATLPARSHMHRMNKTARAGVGSPAPPTADLRARPTAKIIF